MNLRLSLPRTNRNVAPNKIFTFTFNLSKLISYLVDVEERYLRASNSSGVRDRKFREKVLSLWERFSAFPTIGGEFAIPG